jgi:hypothetical protein
MLNFDSKFIKYFFYCILICFTALIIDGFYQYFFRLNIFGFESPAANRVSSFFGKELILGSYLSKIWPIFFGLSIFFMKKKFFSFVLILIFILSEVLIFVSGDRSAFFIMNFSAIFVILFSRKLLKLRVITLLSSIFLLIIISLVNPTAKERVFDQTLDQMNLYKKNENKQIGRKLEINIYRFVSISKYCYKKIITRLFVYEYMHLPITLTIKSVIEFGMKEKSACLIVYNEE